MIAAVIIEHREEKKKAQSVVIIEKENCWLFPPSQLPSVISIFLFDPLEIFLMMIKQNVCNPQPQSNAKIADLMKKEPPSCWI